MLAMSSGVNVVGSVGLEEGGCIVEGVVDVSSRTRAVKEVKLGSDVLRGEDVVGVALRLGRKNLEVARVP